MSLPDNYDGEAITRPKMGDGDIVGPAGQRVGSGPRAPSEPISAWGGLRGGESYEQEKESKVDIGAKGLNAEGF